MWWLVPSYANKGVGLLLWSAKIELEQRNMVDKERTIFGLDTIYRIFPKAPKIIESSKNATWNGVSSEHEIWV